MSHYAAQTTVPVEKSKAEIERLLAKYGANEFASGWNAHAATVMFSMQGKRIKFVLPLPDLNDKAIRLNRYGSKDSDSAIQRKYDQAHRQRWRALLLAIKAKLEAVESNITSFESEFLAHFVVPGDGRTMGEVMIPQLQQAYTTGKALPPLLEYREVGA